MNKTMATVSYGVIDKVESLKILLGVSILFAGGQIAIPLEPVPITLTTVSVMLIGLLYSKKSALLSVIIFTALGGMGFPVFQGFAGGFTHLYGPTAGFIFGFSIAVWVMTTFRNKFGIESFGKILLNCTIGTVVIFICGISWLAVNIGLKNAILFGLLPFIIPGAAKAILLSGALRIINGRKFFVAK